MNLRLIVALFILLLAVPSQGQRRHLQKTQRVKKISPEEQIRQEKQERMKAAMQKVMFIDSIVVDKDNFQTSYLLSPETGSIKDGDDFFHLKASDGFFVYLNEIGNRCYFSKQESDSTSNIYFTEATNTEWSQPVQLKGINDDKQFQHVNYPYMMGDGTTLYFAADGDPEGLGGYDIYMTTFDEEEKHFLHPVNIGLPFNSEANDYLYIVDEYANLGWFATDRNQEEGKVCIYVFVPSEKRVTYNANDYTPEEINDFAQIRSISNTWDDEETYSLAINRLAEVRKAERPNHYSNINNISFVINDDITYHQLSEFKLSANVMRFQQLTSLHNRQVVLSQTLDKIREAYMIASEEGRKAMKDEIISYEQEVLTLHLATQELEKTIRNSENTYLTKSK
jgi:hypothetical protein